LPRQPAQYDTGAPATMIGPKLRAHRGRHQHLPAGLAIADHGGLAWAVRVQLDDFFKERRFGAHDVFDRLARHRVGQKADEVARVSGAQGGADLAFALESADARTVPRARVEDDERAQAPRIAHAGDVACGLEVVGGDDAHEAVVDRARQRSPVDDQLGGEVEHVGRIVEQMRLILVATLTQHVGEQDAALPGVDGVLDGGLHERHAIRNRGSAKVRRGGLRLWLGHRRSEFPQIVGPGPVASMCAV
jgi:hypothetical protein